MVSSNPGAVGIDGISVYVPKLYLELGGEWARARASAAGTDVATLAQKLSKGIGVRRMAIPDAHEDSATMAAMAAKRLIDRLGLDPTDIGYLAVGTETTVDQSKSIGAYVLGMLSRHYGVPLSHVGCPQIQFACIGATYALEAACALVRSGALRGRSALVIATDVARYPKGDPGECTQGAGAVAMRVSAAPRLLELDGIHWPTISLDERDFFRPNWSSEAVVDGHYSVDLYLECVDRALCAALEAGGNEVAGQLLESDHFLFHTPFPRMAEYAAARLYRRLAGLREANATPARGSASEERAVDREVQRTAEFQAWFDTRCKPALGLLGDIGNVYSGALYLSLASLLEGLAERAAAARRFTLFSYGSGASAKLFSAVLPPASVVQATGLALDLTDRDAAGGTGRRRALRLSEYDRLHDLHGQLSARRGVVPESVARPTNEFALLRYGSERSDARVDVGYRYYDFVSAP